jgi:crotonobetainyl-CoA:carnitine CoA-transferase CaiB-like acyl-CoA transferase
MTAPLDGIRVVEISSWMAAPSAGAFLSDLGARVLKVEPLTGDPARGMGRQPKVEGRPEIDESFQMDNRGKRSLAIDMSTDEGAEMVRRLVADADVLMCNLLPRRQERFGLDPDTLFEIQPKLVHATLTGYGTVGPDAERPGYDVTAFFGRGGISDSSTEPGGPLPVPRPAQGDHTTCLALVAGILAALRMVDRTGEGQAVQTSLFHTAAWTMASDYAPTLIDGREPTRRDRRHQISPMVNRYRCGDDKWLIVNMPEPHWWGRLCKVIDMPEWADDPRYETPKGRFDHMPELVDQLDAIFAGRSRDQWADIFDASGLIWGPALTMVETAADPQAEAAGLWTTLDHPDVGEFRTVAVPVKLPGADIGPRGLAPALGEHTDEVLAGLGLDSEAIAALRHTGVVA